MGKSIKVYKHSWRTHDAYYIRNDAGQCTLNVYVNGFSELFDFLVYPGHRGQGYGRQLMETAIKVAKSEKCTHMALWPDCESWVEEWYRRLGFREGRSITNWSGEYAWVKRL